MARSLKIIYIAALLLSFSGATNAANLCNLNCTLSITFPTGGSIEARETLTISFGDGGLIDTAGSVTAYLAGETLTLNAGESLVFEDGGSFDIGAAGNITYIDMALVTDGVLRLAAVGGDAQIQIPENHLLALQGSAELDIDSSIVVFGTLELGSDSTLGVSGAGAPAGCNLTSSGGVILTGNGGVPFVLDHGASCLETQTLFNNTGVITAGSLSLVDPVSNLITGTIGTLNPVDAVVIDAGPLILSASAEFTNGSEKSVESDEENAGLFDAFMLWLVVALLALRRMRPRFSSI